MRGADNAMSKLPGSSGDGVLGREPSPRSACDHSDRARWQQLSTHETSGGAVGYARCSCGAWLLLLDGELLAAAGGPAVRGTRGRCPTSVVGRDGGHEVSSRT
jgi:hypothetical protein